MAALPLATILAAMGVLEPSQAPMEVQRLGLQEAIQVALRNNLQVEIAQQARKVTQAGIPSAEGQFDWNLSASLQTSRTQDTTSFPVYPGVPSIPYNEVTTTRGGANGGSALDLASALPWGANADISWSPSYTYWRSVLLDPSGNPIPGATQNVPAPYSGSLTASYSQNLLQGAGREVSFAPVTLARRNGAAADYTFQLSIINLVAATESCTGAWSTPNGSWRARGPPWPWPRSTWPRTSCG